MRPPASPRFRARSCGLLVLLTCLAALPAADLGDLGSFPKWQKVEIVVSGPNSTATGTPNPFNLLMDVTFTRPDASTITVPGFYNGNNAGSANGNKWVVRFGPDQVGTWSFITSSSTSALNGHTGSFSVTAIPGNAPGFYAWGRLEHPGTAANQIRYLKFRDGPYWIKGGADSPESFLSLTPGWRWDTNAKRKAAVDYLAGVEINSMYIMTLNSTGDSPKGVWPFLGDTVEEVNANKGNGSTLDDPALRFSIPRLDEWLEVFEYMQTKGVVVYIIGEDDDTSGPGNRLRYYRELIARYGWMPGVMFNTREEGGSTWEQLEKWTAVDPYGIPAAGHNINSPSNNYIDSPHTDMTSMQTNNDRGGLVHNQTTIDWINACKSRNQRVLMVSFDEPRGGAIPRQKWWAAYLGGAGGYEEIFVPIDKGDIDFPAEDTSWRQLAGARRFIEAVEFWTMDPSNDLVTAGNAFCLAQPGEQYAIYLIDGASCQVALTSGRTYRVHWWNPENDYGGAFIDGGLVGGGTVTLTPPGGGSAFGDWGIRIRRETGGGNVPPTASDGSATVLPGDSVPITLSYTDPDGPGPHSISIVDAPVHGSLSGSGTTRTYSVDADATPGIDVFTWRVNDGEDDSNLATVTITIDDPANNAPVADDSSVSTSVDSPVEIPLLWEDPDGPGPYTIAIVTPPQHGSVVATSPGGNEYRYTPDAGYQGSDAFQWRVDDGELASNTATVTIQVADQQAGLIAWWPLDDGAGSSTASDASGNGRNGTLVGPDPASAWVAGQQGGALAFAGGGERFEVAGSFVPPQAGSIAFWIRPGSGSGNRLLGGVDAFEINLGSTISNQLFAGGSSVLGGVTTIPIDQWTHVVCTWDHATAAATIWVGGVLDASGSTADDDPGSMTLSVGTRTGQSSSFVGALDDVRIYDRVLSTADIQALAGGGGGGNQPPQITAAPSASDSPVTGTGTGLAVTASDPDGDDAQLVYTWSVETAPGGVPTPTFTPNGSNAAASTAVGFGAAGSYLLRVTVTDAAGGSATGTLTVVVQQSPSGLLIQP